MGPGAEGRDTNSKGEGEALGEMGMSHIFLNEQSNFYKYLCMYVFVAVPGLVAVHGISLALASRGRSLSEVYRLLTAVAPPAVEHWLQGRRAPGGAAQGL